MSCAARRSRLEPEAAVREGEALAAAVAESAEQAHRDWGEQTGHPDAQAFFDAAHRGRRWRAAPTGLLGQLVLNGSPNAASYAEAMAEVCRAAQTLGAPNARTAGNAAVAAAAQLAALTPSPIAATTRPEVVDMLRALDLSSIDLTPWISHPICALEHPQLSPGVSRDNRLQGSCGGLRKKTEPRSPRQSPNPRRWRSAGRARRPHWSTGSSRDPSASAGCESRLCEARPA